jgi:hypothetical protein
MEEIHARLGYGEPLNVIAFAAGASLLGTQQCPSLDS